MSHGYASTVDLCLALCLLSPPTIRIGLHLGLADLSPAELCLDLGFANLFFHLLCFVGLPLLRSLPLIVSGGLRQLDIHRALLQYFLGPKYTLCAVHSQVFFRSGKLHAFKSGFYALLPSWNAVVYSSRITPAHKKMYPWRIRGDIPVHNGRRNP